MVEEKRGGGFWTTLPGILTGTAALVSAVVGAVALFHHNSRSDATPKEAPPAAEGPATASATGGAAPAGTKDSAPPAEAAAGPIASRVQDAGVSASLGKALGPEADAPGGGRSQDFEHASVYWHPRTGAFIVQGAILEKFRAVGGTNFGYPTTDELTPPDKVGRFNHFLFFYANGFPEERSIYWRPDLGPHTTQGLIRAKWKETGWEVGPLGYPVSDEYQAGALRRQDFEHGRIDWSPSTGAQVTQH